MPLETADSKIQEICEKLRKETLDPAREEARLVIESAEKRAEQIIDFARKEAEKIRSETKEELHNQLGVHEVSLELAVKQAISKLKQEVLKVFQGEFGKMVSQEMQKPQMVVDILNALVGAVKKEGLKLNLKVVLPKIVNVDDLFAQLAEEVKSSLKKENIVLGEFKGGVELKLVDRKIAIDMTDQAVKELLISYASEELKQKIVTA